MKKIMLFATAALLAWGCTNDMNDKIAPEGGENESGAVFNVVASSADARTSYSEENGVLKTAWKADDKIDIISVVDGAEYEALTYAAKEDGTKVAFSPVADALSKKEGAAGYKFYAYYQWWKHNKDGNGKYGTSVISYEDGVPYLTLHMNGTVNNGGMQGAVDNDGTSRLYRYDVLWATPVEVADPAGNVDLDFTFNHAFAVLEFKLSTTGSETINVKKISVTGDDLIASNVKVNLTNGALTVGNVISPQISSMNFNIQPVLTPGGTPYSCYMTILPGHAGKKLTITITDNNDNTYTFEKTPSKAIAAGQKAVLPLDVKEEVVEPDPTPEPSAVGVASTTPTLVWSKKLNEIAGVVNHLNVNGLAVSGDYLLLSENGNSSPVYLNALTGEKVGTMNVKAVTDISTNYYATNDEGGYIWFSTPANRDAVAFNIFAADNVTSAPTQMFTENSIAAERYGWRISVSGSKATKAIVATPCFNSNAYSTKYVRRFYWDGSTTVRIEQFVPAGLTAVSDWNWADASADAMNASADKDSDLFTITRSSSSGPRYLTWSTLAWDSANNRYKGTKKEEYAVKYASSGYNVTYTNSLDYIEFNNAKYLAYNTVNGVSTTETSDDCTYLMDITSGAFATPTKISAVNAHGSVPVNGVANANKLADVQLHASADGQYLYAYVMFAGGEVACYRYEAAK